MRSNAYISAGAVFYAVLVSSNAVARTYSLEPGQTAIGEVTTYTTKEEDTLLDVARDNDIGYTELIAANRGIDPWLPGAGKVITIPAFFLLPDVPRQGIVVNLVKQRLFYFLPDGENVETYPVGVGSEGHKTPLGVTRIANKRANPIWYPPPSIRAERPELPGAIPAGPDNPMGAYALYLGWPLYTIHGTNKPYGVGRNTSHGCLRLYPEDIEQLFGQVSSGTRVRVIDDDAEWGWISNDLYLSVFPTKEEADELAIGHEIDPVPPENLKEILTKAAGEQAGRIDWDKVDEVARNRRGIPVSVMKADTASAPSSEPRGGEDRPF